jgi:hypothetical protein
MNEDDFFSDPENQLSEFHEEDWFDAYREERDKVTARRSGQATGADRQTHICASTEYTSNGN